MATITFMMSSAGDGPRAEFCDHFGCVVRLTRSSRRYEITCMRTDVCSRTTKLERALELVWVRWNLRARRKITAHRTESAFPAAGFIR